ncbi:hypothetical protein Tco_1533738 [Tanacetum coccineum]
MVTYLKKTNGSEGFHQIVDFLNTSHIRYALTESPTIYVSLIQQFWQTAIVSTLDNGEIEITATIDGKVKTVSEASIRRHLKLEDSDGISNLPTTEIFKQLALMGYVSNSDKLTFQKGQFSPQWRFLIHTILHCLSSKKTAWEQFSSNIATTIICLATNRKFNFSKMIFDGMVKNLESKHKFLMYPRFIQVFLNKHKRLLLPHNRIYIAPTLTQKKFSNMRRVSKGYTGVDIPLFPTMLVQGLVVQGEGSTHPPKSPTQTNVADEAAQITGLEVGQYSDRVVALTCSRQRKSMVLLFIKLIKTVKKLEKTVKTRQARRKDKIVVSDDEEDLEDPSKQGRKIAEIDEDPDISLVQHDANVQGRHEHDMELDFEFPTAEVVYTFEKGVSTTEAVSTAGVSVSTASASSAKDKGKAIMEEAETIQAKTKLQLEQERLGYEEALRLQAEIDEEERQRIARVQEEASSLNIEEWDEIQARVEADEEFAQRLQSKEREMYSEAEKARLLAELINERKRYFAAQRAEERRNKPLTQAQKRTYILKKQKTEESLEPVEEQKDKEEEELSQEMIQQMMIIVPEQGINVEALQTKYPIIDWEIYTEGARKYWKIIRVGNHTEVYQFFDDMLKAFDREDLLKLLSLVKEKFTSTEPIEDIEREIWVELKRLVHHVSIEDGIDIYMLVETGYPLSRGTLTLMLVVKLLVEHDSEMSRELHRKIFMQVEKPRR